MLPELILREERHEDLPVLGILGLGSVFVGFLVSRHLFPSEADILTVVFSAIPLVYPLTSFFFDDEKDFAPHIPEVANYFSLFAGQVIGFMVLGFYYPDFFAVQSAVAGISGNATAPSLFMSVLINNIGVFLSIAAVSLVVGSAGTFILTWNASVLGVFLADLLRRLPGVYHYLTGTAEVPTPLAYVPHATFEMTGFILAGVSGSLMSAAVYREHFDLEHWKDFGKLMGMGVACILIGAMLEAL